jgi:hypothetical protein
VLNQHQGWVTDAINMLCVVLCRVHYTPKLREHDIGVLTLGQFMLDIPPGKSQAVLGHGWCSVRNKKRLCLQIAFLLCYGSVTAELFRWPDQTCPDNVA